MPFFGRKPDVSERLAVALERLVALYELELRARGLTLHTGDEIGEVYDFDPALVAREEEKDELRTQLGLPEQYPVGAAWHDAGAETPYGEAPGTPTEAPGTPKGPQGFDAAWGIGPEGAEDPAE